MGQVYWIWEADVPPLYKHSRTASHGCLLAWGLCLLLAMSAAATEPSHGFSYFGDLKYAKDMPHFDYVDQTASYGERVDRTAPLKSRLAALAKLRAEEGYMASVEADGTGYLLIENHCPVCAAAKVCQGLCASELALFRRVLGDDVTVERIDHILAGARRCAYRVAARS